MQKSLAPRSQVVYLVQSDKPIDNERPVMLLPHIPGFKVRPLQVGDATAWADYMCLPEVKAHTSSTATTMEDVLAVIQRCNLGEANSRIR